MTETKAVTAGRSTRHPLRRVVVLVAMCGVVVLVLAVAAVAFFTGSGTGSGAVVVGSVTPAIISAASVSNGAVTVTWSTQAGATPPSVDKSITYSVLRKAPASSSFAQVTSGSCALTVADGATSCSDSSVMADGSYSYEVVASLGSFTATSNVVAVNVSVTPPTDSVSLVSPIGAYLESSTDTVYVNTKVGGSFGLADAVQANGTSPASASFPGIATAGWSGHTMSEIVSTGTGTSPRITYTSSSRYSFAPSAVPTTAVVSSTDGLGNTSAGVGLVFTPISNGPTRGSLSADGTAGTSGGASILTSAATFPLSWSSFAADDSGVATSSLIVRFAPWSTNACGSYGSATPITASSPSIETETSGDGCYQYTLSQTDNVGITSSLSTTVEVDTTAPVTTDDSVSIGSGWQDGAQTVSLAPTDAGSGVASTYYTSDGTMPVEIGGVPQGTTQAGTSVVLSSSGTFIIKYFSVDEAGNVEPVKTATSVIRIDLVPPSVPAPIVNGHS